MNTTVKKTIEFSNAALEFLNSNKEIRTPFTYALSKVQKKCVPVIEKFQKELNEFAEDQRVELCEKEKDGTMKEKETDGRVRKVFTADSEKALRKSIREKEDILLKESVEISEHISKDEFIPNLNLFYIEAFEGFVIPTLSEDQKEALYLKQSAA